MYRGRGVRCGSIQFLLWLKLLALGGSAIFASAEGAAWIDVTGELQVHTIREEGFRPDLATVLAMPKVYAEIALRLVTWQHLIFQELSPLGPLVGGLMTVLSGFAVLSAFRSHLRSRTSRAPLLGERSEAWEAFGEASVEEMMAASREAAATPQEEERSK